MTELGKDLISLAGKLEWQMNHEDGHNIPSIIKQMRTKLTQIEKLVNKGEGM
uniref:ORF45 n=1 Tax=Nitrosopumilaceae spindle-shaped virus TaxID=3065433 RepID=A0AAT9JFK9_9VIRU